MKSPIIVSIDKPLLEEILEGARQVYPRESILILRGKKRKGTVTVTDLLVPPLATRGHGFANIPLHMLPMDLSLVGTVHSHPSGMVKPSAADLNHFLGVILMIVGYPFTDEKNIAVYDRDGEPLILQVNPDG